jgi:hypothetical protein
VERMGPSADCDQDGPALEMRCTGGDRTPSPETEWLKRARRCINLDLDELPGKESPPRISATSRTLNVNTTPCHH